MANTGLFTSASGAGGILPDDFGPLIEQPVAKGSVAYQVSTVIPTQSHSLNFPQVTDDPAAAWTAEGADIAEDTPDLAELTVTPSKVAGLTPVSNEMANDSTPAALEVVGNGLARDIAKKIDSAYFGDTTTNGPSGLESVTGVSTATYANGGPSDFDWAAAAISKADEKGLQISAFVTDSATALTLMQLKVASDHNTPLMASAGAVNAMERQVLGVPLLVSSAVTTGTIWAIPKSVSYVVQREGADVQVDHSVYFGSDRVAVRAIMRVGFGFVHPAGLVKVTEAAA